MGSKMGSKVEMCKFVIVVVAFFIIMMTIVTVVILQNGNQTYKENRVSYQDDPTVSRFGSNDYSCVGKCYCSSEDNGRRSGALSTMGVSVVTVIFVAFTSLLAHQEAVTLLYNECEQELTDCDHSSIYSEVDFCYEIDVLPEEHLRDLKSFVEKMVRNGFYDADNIYENCLDDADGRIKEIIEKDNSLSFPDELASELCERLIEEAIKKQKEWEKEWTEATDCDRLDAAFEELNNEGIVARQNAMCCWQCAFKDIHDEIKDLEKESGKVDGFLYYPWSATDNAEEGGGLVLCFGEVFRKAKAEDATQSEIDATARIGLKIEEVLTKHGLEVLEIEDLEARQLGGFMTVKMDWKKRSKLEGPPPKSTTNIEFC